MTDLKQRRMLIASRLKLARTNAGLTQGQVAKLLNIPRPSVSDAESGKRRVAGEELTELAKLYGVGVAWLAGEGAEQLDPVRDRMELAARELSKLKNRDVETLLTLLAAMRDGEKSK